MTINFQDISYSNHAKTYQSTSLEKEIELYDNWFNKATVDVWRHLRMLDFTKIISKYFPGSSWLTIGDGRFGTAAIYLQKHGGQPVATDIDDTLLKISAAKGWINKWELQNAEKLTYEDNSFDFSLCKQAYHHFPRPSIAVYEMLRVSRKAVMFIEPRDWQSPPLPGAFLFVLKRFFRKMAGLKVPHTDNGAYEPDGNYIYGISEREFQKIALGLNCPYVAFKSLHDVYIPGVEQELLKDNGPLFNKIKVKINIQKLKTRLGLIRSNNIIALILKEDPGIQFINALKTDGFTIISLPRNPYV